MAPGRTWMMAFLTAVATSPNPVAVRSILPSLGAGAREEPDPAPRVRQLCGKEVGVVRGAALRRRQ